MSENWRRGGGLLTLGIFLAGLVKTTSQGVLGWAV